MRACVQGRFCARRPGLVLAVAAAVVALCALGLVRLRVETDPQRLWVGAGSQAAREKADYEARAAPRQRACTGAALPARELAAPVLRTLQSPRQGLSLKGPGGTVPGVRALPCPVRVDSRVGAARRTREPAALVDRRG